MMSGVAQAVPLDADKSVSESAMDYTIVMGELCRWVLVRWDGKWLSLHRYGVLGEHDALVKMARLDSDEYKNQGRRGGYMQEKVDRAKPSRPVSYRPDGSVEGVRIKIAAFESGAVKKGKEDVSRSVSKESAGPSSFVRSVVKELESKKLFARSVRSREEGDESLRRQRSSFQHQQHLTRSGLTGRKGRRELGLEAVLEDEPAESFASVKADLRRPLPLLGSAATSRLNSSVQSTNRVGLSGTGRDRTILFRGSLDDTCLCVSTTAVTGRIEGPPGESLRGSDSIPLVERESRGGRSSVGMAATGSAKRPKSIGYGRTGLSALSTSIELGKSDNNQRYRDKIFGGHEMRGHESGGQRMAVGCVVIRGVLIIVSSVGIECVDDGCIWFFLV